MTEGGARIGVEGWNNAMIGVDQGWVWRGGTGHREGCGGVEQEGM